MRQVFLIALFYSAIASASGPSSWRPTMEADPAETGAEGFIYLNTLGQAYKVDPNRTFCQFTRESYQEHGKYTVSRYRVHPEGKKKQSARSDFECYTFKKQADADAPSIREFTLAGFALSDLYCRNFFHRISLHTSQRRFARNVVNDVGTAVSAILGLASAGSAATGAVGAAFGASDSIFRDYDDNFLISADLPNVQKQVFVTQQNYKTDTLAKLPDNYFEAAMAIQQHANFCSYVGMKQLINEAVQKDTNEKDKTTPTGSQISETASVSVELIKLNNQFAAYKLSQKNQSDRDALNTEIDLVKKEADQLKVTSLIVKPAVGSVPK